jgi:hypothetical protein
MPFIGLVTLELKLHTKSGKEKPYSLPPMDPFSIQRSLPEADAFEEDLRYFDLPGGASEDFESCVNAKLNDIESLEGTRVSLRVLLVKYKDIFPEYHIGMPGNKGLNTRLR